MRVVTIYCRVTRVTAHTFVPSTNKHKLWDLPNVVWKQKSCWNLLPLVSIYIVCAIKLHLFIFLHSL